MQEASSLLRDMETALVAAVAAFAALASPCPLGLPLVCPALEDTLQEQLLAAALSSVAGSAQAAALPPAVEQQVQQLRQRHALLATMARIDAAAGSRLPVEQVKLTRQAAEQVQQQAADSEAGKVAVRTCLVELLVAGCDMLGVLSVAFELASLLEHPAGLAAPRNGQDATAASLQLAQQAAEEAVARALAALSSSPAPVAADGTQLSAGDAIQHLYGTMRALDAPSAQLLPAAAPAVEGLRLLVWRQLQQHLAACGEAALSSSAAAEATLQVGR